MERLIANEKLFRKLENARHVSLIAMEAPAGYGKTTVMHKELDGSPDPVVWYTAASAVPDTSFRWFIGQLAMVDEKAAQDLAALGFLNRSNADEAARIISGIRAASPLTLVFDNFQFSLGNWQPQIFEGLARQPAGGIRTVFLSQNFGRLSSILGDLEESICFIRGTELLLSESDLRHYAAKQGLSITPGEIRRISQKTEGWAAAVSLYLDTFTGAQEESAGFVFDDINSLLDEHLWRRLSAQQRDLLLHLCKLDKLSERDAGVLFEDKDLSEGEVADFLRWIPLIRYQETRRVWYPHEILLGFLKWKFAERDEAFRHAVLVRSAEVYEMNGLTKEAVSCFYHAGDYEHLLKLPLTGLLTETFEGASLTEIAEQVFRKTPEDVQKKYPLSLLRLCYALYGGCAFREFDRWMKKVKSFIEETQDPQLLGEWYIMSAFSDFPDIEKMHAKYRIAEDLMERPSDIFVREEPFLFGCTSMWYLFYTEPGKMMELADRFADMMKCYNRLTNGHGSGAAEIYRGEALSVQGRFEESDIQAYQAAFLSEQAKNATITYGAALLLGINAIYSSDMSGLKKAIDYLENKAQGYAFLQGKMLNTYMVETVRGYLLGLMMETGRSALWTQGEADSLSDLTFTTFMIKTCRITDMLLKKEYKQAIASVETSLQLDERLISVPTKNFMYCGLALCYMAIGRLLKASEYLDKSLTLAGQDKNYTFLACFRKYFQVLFLMPRIAAKHGETIREIKALNINYTRADESRIFSMLDEDPEPDGLTEREQEVAQLAAQGYRNQEIAKALFISENTVKHHLKIIFQKMNIDRRSKLVEMLR